MPNPIWVVMLATLVGWIAGAVYDQVYPESGEALLAVFACGFITTIIGALIIGAVRFKRMG